MTRIGCRTAMALVIAAAMGPVGHGRAETEIQFRASGHGVHVSIEKIQGGLHVVNVIPDGQSDLGAWIGNVDLTVKGGHFAGTLVLNFASGDTLSVTFEQKRSHKIGEFGGATGEYVVTGG